MMGRKTGCKEINGEEKQEIKTLYENGGTICHISQITGRSVFSVRKICIYETGPGNKVEEKKEKNNRKCKICKKEHNENIVYVGRYGICFECFNKCYNRALRKLETLQKKNNIVLNTKT